MLFAVRISLRTWMVLVTALVLIFGYWAKQGRQQEQIVTALLSSGARVRYRYQYDDYDDVEKYSPNNTVALPWIARRIGVDFFSPVVQVSSIGADDPAGIVRLASRLPGLREMQVSSTVFDDNDLQSLKMLADNDDLISLILKRTQMEDRAVPYLTALRSLTYLNIEYTGLSPNAIEALKAALPNTRIAHSCYFDVDGNMIGEANTSEEMLYGLRSESWEQQLQWLRYLTKEGPRAIADGHVSPADFFSAFDGDFRDDILQLVQSPNAELAAEATALIDFIEQLRANVSSRPSENPYGAPE